MHRYAHFRTNRLVACLSAALGLSATSATTLAANLPVSSCADDNSAGTLRNVIAAAASGDTVDMSGLTCSSITVAPASVGGNGVLVIPHNVTLQGPGSDQLVIQGYYSPVLYSSSTDPDPILSVKNLTIANGYTYSYGGSVQGACIRALGEVDLTASVVSNCQATSANNSAQGGAIWTRGTVFLFASTVSGSTARTGNLNTFVQGGGIYAQNLVMVYSTLTGNTVSAPTAGYAQGGGGFAFGGLYMNSTTVDSNSASDGAGLAQFPGTNTAGTTIKNSTITGNTASEVVGGFDLYCFGCSSPATAELYNSTIAFNQAGGRVGGLSSNIPILAHSSIIGDNRNAYGSTNDLFFFSNTLTGADNLVMSTNVTPEAGVVALTSDPKLTPLAYHGASQDPSQPRAQTLGLSISSPAIGMGDDLINFQDDERGDQAGGFARSIDGLTDIGAFERQVNDDELFYGGFR